MSFPYGLVQAGQSLCFFVGQCHLDNTLLPGLVHVGSPHFLFRETGRASARNPVGRVGNAAGPFQAWNSLLLCSAERSSALLLEGVPQGPAVEGSRSAGLGGRQPERHSGDSITGPATLAASHQLSETLFSYLQDGGKSSLYPRMRIK